MSLAWSVVLKIQFGRSLGSQEHLFVNPNVLGHSIVRRGGLGATQKRGGHQNPAAYTLLPRP
jgi:hypothetical protein